MSSKPSPSDIKSLLSRGVAEVIVREHLEARLRKRDKLRVKFGIDPTGPLLHIGHTVALRLLRRFQDFGHTIIFLVGDFTARIGDPTGRTESRPMLAEAEIKKNMAGYFEQAGKVLDIEKAELRYNNEWYEHMNLVETHRLLSSVTYGQALGRRDFKKRLKADDDFTVAELMYPVLQGYDSVALKADVEVGGTDQKFNMLMGRRVQRRYGQAEQDVITVPLLVGTDGVKKMSKSEDNYISLNETAESMFGTLMAVADSAIVTYFELCTDVALREVEEMRVELRRGVNPRDIKARLAREIVALYHGVKAAKEAAAAFDRVFRKKEIPDDIPTVSIKHSHILKNVRMNVVEILVAARLVASKSEARRVMLEGGVRVGGKVIKDPRAEIILDKNGVVVQKGKRYFVRVVP